MKGPSFTEGVVVALAAALAASLLATVLVPLFGEAWVSRALVAGLGLGYVLYLLKRSPERSGRIATLVAWFTVAAAAWLLLGSLSAYFALHLGMLWLVRAFHHQPGPLAAILDLGLHLLAAAGAVWALLHTGSVFLGVWTFFLVQALYVLVPSALDQRRAARAASDRASDRFQEARRNAENALRRLSGSH